MLGLLVLPLLAEGSGKVEVFPATDMRQKLAEVAPQAKSTGIGMELLGDYTSHSIRVITRTTSGAAEVHQHLADVIVVTDGSATLVSGGTLENPRTESEGELRGPSIKDGQSRALAVGDVVHVPAGVPHQFLVPAGGTYAVLVIKVKE
jgi:mannose-6-phosphate isomerase-like protein (cupin superfamily)